MASSKILGVDAVKIAELGIIVANEGFTSLNDKLTTDKVATPSSWLESN